VKNEAAALGGAAVFVWPMSADGDLPGTWLFRPFATNHIPLVASDVAPQQFS
jgi:hypothetical protein